MKVGAASSFSVFRRRGPASVRRRVELADRAAVFRHRGDGQPAESGGQRQGQDFGHVEAVVGGLAEGGVEPREPGAGLADRAGVAGDGAVAGQQRVKGAPPVC